MAPVVRQMELFQVRAVLQKSRQQFLGKGICKHQIGFHASKLDSRSGGGSRIIEVVLEQLEDLAEQGRTSRVNSSAWFPWQAIPLHGDFYGDAALLVLVCRRVHQF